MNLRKIDLYKAIATSLRVGVLTAALLCVVGLGAWALSGYSEQTVFSATNVVAVFGQVATGDYAGIVYLGVLLLIATPIFRVALAILGFSIEKDRSFVLISLAVLTMLLLGIFSGSIA